MPFDGGYTTQAHRRIRKAAKEPLAPALPFNCHQSSTSESSSSDDSSSESNVGSDSGFEPISSKVRDEDPIEQLGPVSLWRGSAQINRYVYWPQAGEGVTIYVLDTGANIQSNVFLISLPCIH